MYVADFIIKIKFEDLGHKVTTRALSRSWENSTRLEEKSDFSISHSFTKITLSATGEKEPPENQCLLPILYYLPEGGTGEYLQQIQD